MFILAVDTALATCAAALLETGSNKILARLSEPMRTGQAERLAPMVQDVCRDAGVELRTIDRAAATAGPGTFTGVRLGLSFVRGLGVALRIDSVGVPTLKALAHSVRKCSRGSDVWVLQDARRGMAYMQGFTHNAEPLGPIELLDLQDVPPRLRSKAGILVGSACTMVDVPPAITVLPDRTAADIAAVARLAASCRPDNFPPEAIYVRPADAKPQPRLVSVERPKLQFSPTNPLHGEVLARLHAACCTRAWDREGFAGLLGSKGAWGVIASDTGHQPPSPVGFIVARAVEDEAEILMLAVLPDYRRRGVASGLLSKAVDEFKARGVRTCHLEVAADNNPARLLYGKFGFTETALRPRYYRRTAGTPCDAVCAQLSLNGG